MNERIRQLARQSTGASTIYMLEEEWEKFAELLLDECIVTIQMGITRDGHTTEKYQRSVKHINDIKQHFGIEE